jgi:hypothetical protein
MQNITSFILHCPAQWIADFAFEFANVVKPAQSNVSLQSRM